MKRVLIREHGGPVAWEAFLIAFREQYFLVAVRERKEIEFLELVQGNLLMAQYEAKFVELSCFAPHMVVDEARKAYKFKRGLKPSIWSKLSALMLRSYSSIVAQALVVEQDLKEFEKPLI